MGSIIKGFTIGSYGVLFYIDLWKWEASAEYSTLQSSEWVSLGSGEMGATVGLSFRTPTLPVDSYTPLAKIRLSTKIDAEGQMCFDSQPEKYFTDYTGRK